MGQLRDPNEKRQGDDLGHALEEAAQAARADPDDADIAADDAGGTRLAEALDDAEDEIETVLSSFGQGSLVGELGEELGLTNAWTGEVDPAYGLGQTDIEGMTEVGDATFFYTGTTDPAGDVNAELAKNKVWGSIPAVAEDRA